MENPTPFELDQAIQRWRENLAQWPAFRRENLCELETHLRDSIAALQSRELSAAEAFLVATRRIGNAGALENEFGKFNSSAIWLERALWILIGSQLWNLASSMAFNCQIFLNISLPKVNEWLAAYGLGSIPESVPGQVSYVIALPLIIVVDAKLCCMTHRWGEQRGLSPLTFLLARPRLLACAYTFLYFSPMVFNYGMGLLLNKYGLNRYSGISVLSGFPLVALIGLNTAVFAVLVMILARKRLRAREA